MFIRRVFYDFNTGEVLKSYMMQGNFKPRTAAQEAAALGLENWAVLAWHEPDREIEQSFIDSYGRISVDVSGETAKIIFDFTPLPAPDPDPTEYEEYYNAVSAALGGE